MSRTPALPSDVNGYDAAEDARLLTSWRAPQMRCAAPSRAVEDREAAGDRHAAWDNSTVACDGSREAPPDSAPLADPSADWREDLTTLTISLKEHGGPSLGADHMPPGRSESNGIFEFSRSAVTTESPYGRHNSVTWA